ncbi:MAG TPA: hypothetical protein PLD95_04570 [bacterium]|jgi:hypothetical protein|nr:hypothetical protein [bacterium]HOG38709.1 hypothetical protein [bacterium]HQI03562.1 hypothetical protein [bacterium]
MSKKILLVATIILVIGGLSFYIGMNYEKSRKLNFLKNNNFQGDRNFQGNQNGQMRRIGQDGGFVAGSIISKDDKIITVKLNDGGSKIVFFGDSTKIIKSATGTVADLNVNTNVMINGIMNSDGSITAENIQIR